MTTDLREQIEASFGDGPAHRHVADDVAAGRAAVRRRRHGAVAGVAIGACGVGLALALALPGSGLGGGLVPSPPPAPSASSTVRPYPVHLLVAPPQYVGPDTPPVLYLYGRMYRASHDVTVLTAFGDVDQAAHPRGGAIVRVHGRTSWVLLAGNEPESISEQYARPYDYSAFMTWALPRFEAMSGQVALAVTAPGPYRPPVLTQDSPATFSRSRLVAKPGGSVVQRVQDPPHDTTALSCTPQAARIRTAGGDWFVLGDDCAGAPPALYSERVGVRSDRLTTWLTDVAHVQEEYVR